MILKKSTSLRNCETNPPLFLINQRVCASDIHSNNRVLLGFPMGVFGVKWLSGRPQYYVQQNTCSSRSVRLGGCDKTQLLGEIVGPLENRRCVCVCVLEGRYGCAKRPKVKGTLTSPQKAHLKLMIAPRFCPYPQQSTSANGD